MSSAPHLPGSLCIREIRIIDYLIVFWCINMSGNLAFITAGRQEPLLVLTALFMTLRLLSYRMLLNKTILFVAVFNAVIFTYQSIILDFFASVTIAGFYIRLIIAAGAVATVAAFRFLYVRIMVWLAAFSFVFHVPAVIASLGGVNVAALARPLAGIVGAQATGVNERVNILIHNFMGGEHAIRNSGIFWEPGAFSGYLILALILLVTIHDKLPQKTARNWMIILCACVLSTMSTTGILCLPLVWTGLKLMKFEKSKDFRKELRWFPFAILLLIPVGFYVWSLEFVGPKIAELYTRAILREAGWEVSRFGSMIFDWEYIRKSPLVGWGQNNATQFSLHEGFTDYRLGNGFSGYLRQMGILGMGLLLLSLLYGLRAQGVPVATSAWIALGIVILLNGQYFLNYPIFNTLYFICIERRFLKVSKAARKPSIEEQRPDFDEVHYGTTRQARPSP